MTIIYIWNKPHKIAHSEKYYTEMPYKTQGPVLKSQAKKKLTKKRGNKTKVSISKTQHQRHVRDDDTLLNMILGEQEFNQEEFDNAVANLEMEVELAKKKEEEITNQMRNKYKGL